MQIKNFLMVASLSMCLMIVFHHYVKHINDFHLTEHEKIFQLSDVSNHESFVFLFFGIFIGVLLSKFY